MKEAVLSEGCEFLNMCTELNVSSITFQLKPLVASTPRGVD